ncbi:MAG: hypothetical protein GY753_09900 [Gammaproteobacteria bacterium]|nr:hypothetical protein [Gammaproteobacteria bacterium]
MKKLPNGAEVIKQSGNFVLCLFRGEYVTWAYNPKDGSAYWGHYFQRDLQAAAADLEERAK